MKKRRSLPDIDLARITVMPVEQQRSTLEKMKLSFAPFSYDPTRKNILDILNAQVNPLMPLPRTPWESIKNNIKRKCATNIDGYNANIGVAEALYNFSLENDITGLKHDFLDFPVGIADRVRYWSPLVININGRPTVPFIEPRRTKGLTQEARRFVLSVMNQRIRLLDLDFSEISLVIFQFSTLNDGKRGLRPNFDDGLELLGFEEILHFATQTYSLWEDVLAEREAETRRRGGKASGTLI